MDTRALQLACRFSLPPNFLGYCGKDTAPGKFEKCVVNGVCSNVEEELAKFIVLNPYLETIAEILKNSKFSYQVIEAYWLGNDELSKAKVSDYSTLLDNFSKQGVPPWFVEELRDKIPEVFIPHHLFQVLHVGVGKASGSVQFNLESINNCMIRWGKVTQIEGNKVTANLNSLDKGKGGYKIAIKGSCATFSANFLPEIKLGDVVAVHWNQAVKILTLDEARHLLFWTNEVIRYQK